MLSTMVQVARKNMITSGVMTIFIHSGRYSRFLKIGVF